MDALAFGGLLALMSSDRALAIRLRPLISIAATFAMVALPAICISSGTTALSVPMLSIGYTCLGLVSTCFVWKASESSGENRWLNRLLRLSALRQLGKYSYGIYVLHYPIVILLLMARENLAPRFPLAEKSGLFLLLSLIFGFGLSYLAALASWFLLEKRALKLKNLFNYSQAKTSMPVDVLIETESNA
jgi:peptidoglycan/LPS O-acetylase OafA/YrhL